MRQMQVPTNRGRPTTHQFRRTHRSMTLPIDEKSGCPLPRRQQRNDLNQLIPIIRLRRILLHADWPAINSVSLPKTRPSLIDDRLDQIRTRVPQSSKTTGSLQYTHHNVSHNILCLRRTNQCRGKTNQLEPQLLICLGVGIHMSRTTRTHPPKRCTESRRSPRDTCRSPAVSDMCDCEPDRLISASQVKRIGSSLGSGFHGVQPFVLLKRG